MATPNGAVILVRMPHDLKDALDTYAYEHDLATSEVIRQACAALVDCEYTHQHGNTKHSAKERQQLQRNRASQRRQLLRKLLTTGADNGQA